MKIPDKIRDGLIGDTVDLLREQGHPCGLMIGGPLALGGATEGKSSLKVGAEVAALILVASALGGRLRRSGVGESATAAWVSLGVASLTAYKIFGGDLGYLGGKIARYGGDSLRAAVDLSGQAKIESLGGKRKAIQGKRKLTEGKGEAITAFGTVIGQEITTRAPILAPIVGLVGARLTRYSNHKPEEAIDTKPIQVLEPNGFVRCGSVILDPKPYTGEPYTVKTEKGDVVAQVQPGEALLFAHVAGDLLRLRALRREQVTSGTADNHGNKDSSPQQPKSGSIGPEVRVAKKVLRDARCLFTALDQPENYFPPEQQARVKWISEGYIIGVSHLAPVVEAMGRGTVYTWTVDNLPVLQETNRVVGTMFSKACGGGPVDVEDVRAVFITPGQRRKLFGVKPSIPAGIVVDS